MKKIVVLGAGKIGRMVAHSSATAATTRCASATPHRRRSTGFTEHLAVAEDGSSTSRASRTSTRSSTRGRGDLVRAVPLEPDDRIAREGQRRALPRLTEDVEVTKAVAKLADGASTAFIPQCGLAPGFITICAVHLMSQLTEVKDLRMRVGALPRYPSNMLKYNLTWSTEGLINEYCQPCEVILNGELRAVQPMENLERITIDGVEYEGFNTSGGLGTLAESLLGKVENVNYKSLRYPGTTT